LFTTSENKRMSRTFIGCCMVVDMMVDVACVCVQQGRLVFKCWMRCCNSVRFH
jgi:hypothetical protein